MAFFGAISILSKCLCLFKKHHIIFSFKAESNRFLYYLCACTGFLNAHKEIKQRHPAKTMQFNATDVSL